MPEAINNSFSDARLARTVERHDFVDRAERVGRDARVLAVVVVVVDVDTQAQRQPATWVHWTLVSLVTRTRRLSVSLCWVSS